MNLDKYFDEWIEDKSVINSINNVYGQTGLLAIVSFINFVKGKEYDYSDRESNCRNQTHYAGTGFTTR